jgi:dTDP-D-glucose 4,6-dehydratase
MNYLITGGCGFIGSNEIITINVLDAPSILTQDYQIDASGNVDMAVIL